MKKEIHGEVRGTIETGLKIGEVYKNGAFGISGSITNKGNLNLLSSNEMEVALRSEIQEGKAYMICELENGKKEKYEIEIEKKYINSIKMGKINIDENPMVALDYRVLSIPTLLFIKDGKVLGRLEEAVTKNVVETKIKKYFNL